MLQLQIWHGMDKEPEDNVLSKSWLAVSKNTIAETGKKKIISFTTR